MSMPRSSEEISRLIREEIIYQSLELEEMAIEIDELTNEILLLDPEGLNLDSVDALEIVVGLQRVFGIQVPNIDKAFFSVHCRSIDTLRRFVEERFCQAQAAE
jgi:acyl carrier protein